MIHLRRLCLLMALAGTAAAQWRHFDATSATADRSALWRQMLVAHNAARAQAGVPPLAWSEHLAVRAQDWAIHLLRHGQFYHRPNSAYGENLFAISGVAASPAQVVEDWASESRNYNYRSNSCHGVCGHYTQIVWRDTKEVGCGVAREAAREVWVCNYDPPGNWAGQRPY